VCRYDVDAAGCITFVDDGWRAFAAANGAPQYADTATLYGVPLFSFMSDNTTQHVYAVLMDRVRRDRVSVRVPFRCDSPTLRRWLELEMTPREDGGITFVSRQLRAEPREAVLTPADAADPARADTLIRMCSWCKKVDAGAAGWLEVEHAVAELGLFVAPRPDIITHGICPECVQLFERGLGYSIEPV
jgi:hypothetical protein